MNSDAIRKVKAIALAKVRASLPGTIERPDLGKKESSKDDSGWKVTVYDNSINTYQEVMVVLMLATECDGEEAYIEAWEIDHFGYCDVHFASESECVAAAQIIHQIGIRVEVSCCG